MVEQRSFRKMLEARQERIGSLLCVGLDPLPEKLPACMKRGRACDLWQQIAEWMMEIVDATAPFASCYKLQRAHWEAIPFGERGMRGVIAHIKEDYSTIPIILDCKRGDINRTQERYREAHFELDGVDAVNFSPYMGKSCMAGLVDPHHFGRGLIGLCYTSNPDAREVQDLLLDEGLVGGRKIRLWEKIAMLTLEWAKDLGVVENAGLVMAAAYEQQPMGSGRIYVDHLKRARELVGDELWFLIPGIGRQGGCLAETIRCSYSGPGTIAFNSSSDIIFASNGDNFAEVAGLKAEEERNKAHVVVNEIVGNMSSSETMLADLAKGK